jgi:hypothetical protein
MSKIKLAGKSISEILKRIKRAQRNKRATQNQEKAGLSVKSVKPWNYRAGARNEQIVPVKKQSQKGSSFQPHRVRGKQGAASIKETSEGSAASWRDEMDKYFGDLRPSKFFKKASGGDINTGMKKLSPKQKAIAAKAPPPDKIDAKDFAVLKAEKAKGRGMGLQDEKIKPGKVMKARTGKAIKADPTKPISSVAPKVTDALKKKKLPGRIGTALGIGSMLVPAAYAAAKQYKDYKSAKNRDKAKVKKYSVGGGADSGRGRYSSMAEMRAAKGFKPGETPAQFNKRRMMLEGAKKAAKATRIGKIAAGIGAAGVAASQYLKKKMEEKKENKKMVGGMAKKYNKGGDLRLDYIDRQTRLNEKATGKKNYIAESKKTRREEYGAAKDRYPNKTDKLRSVAKNVGRALTPSFAAAKSVYDKLSKSSAEKYSVGGGADAGRAGTIKGINANLQDKAERRLNVPDRTDIKKQKTSVTKLKEQAKRSRLEKMKERQTGRPVYERMGGGMMQRPMGYKSGTMVKARGCKLGRTRPTKIT